MCWPFARHRNAVVVDPKPREVIIIHVPRHPTPQPEIITYEFRNIPVTKCSGPAPR